uniref:Uncharacterized protein n=1 Tax=Romanomermis culicivorax TaxID=13658 RepID=A0A915JSQ4_ROMCU
MQIYFHCYEDSFSRFLECKNVNIFLATRAGKFLLPDFPGYAQSIRYYLYATKYLIICYYYIYPGHSGTRVMNKRVPGLPPSVSGLFHENVTDDSSISSNFIGPTGALVDSLASQRFFTFLTVEFYYAPEMFGQIFQIGCNSSGLGEERHDGGHSARPVKCLRNYVHAYCSVRSFCHEIRHESLVTSDTPRGPSGAD